MNYRQFIKQFCHSNAQILSPIDLTLIRTDLSSLKQFQTDLIDCALKLLDHNEAYCRVGEITDVSQLVAELQNHSDQIIYLITNNNTTTNTLEEPTIAYEALGDLESFDRLYVCQQTFEEFFETVLNEALDFKIGVYFHHAPNDYRSCLLSLLLAQNFLADEALIIIENINTSMVQQAVRDFMISHPQCQLLQEIPPHPDPSLSQGYYFLGWSCDNALNSSASTQELVCQKPLIEAIAHLNQHFEFDLKPQALKKLKQEALELQLGYQYQESLEKYFEALAWQPYDPEVWHNLATIYYDLEDLEQAFQAICQSVRINPLAAIGYYTLGWIWEKMGHDLGAVAAYEKSLTLDQDHLKSCNNLGSIYYRLGQFDQALILYKKMIEIQPDFYGSYLNVGNIMIQEQQYEQAISYYQKALKRKPQDCNILYNLGLAYQANGDQKVALKKFALSTYYQQDYEATVNFCNHYLALAQDEPLIYIYLGKSYELLGYYAKAISTFEQGIQKHPKEEALYYLGGLFFQNFAINTKLKELKDQVTHLFPNSVTIELQFLGLLPLVYDSEAELSTYRKNIVAALDRIETLFDSQRPIEQIHAIFLNINSFYIFYQGQCDREIQERLGWIFHQTMTTLYPQWSQPLKVPPLTAQGKIKVGYISSCMCNHVVGLMTLGWLKHHDKNQFDLYSYYVGKQLDSVTQKFQLYSHSFYQIDELERLCEQILQDQVHILVFLDMGMVPFMMQMGCLRLAPIQCKFWGPPVTSGLPTIDYFLSSDLMEPEQGLEHYSETLVRLPQIAVSYPKPSTIDLTKTRADFGIGETRIAYFCCQVPQKYLPQYDSIFLEIAQKVPDAQFVFIERKNPHVMQHLLDRIGRIFAQVHLSFQDYFVLIPPVSALEFLNVNLLCDVTLDTFEWSGGKTGLDSLACGVPVVTCPGQLMRGRHSYGILQMLGVIDTIARSEAEYIDIAVRLGLNKQWRQDIAQKIQNHHDRLFDDMDCIQGLEAFYIQVVQESLQEFSP